METTKKKIFISQNIAESMWAKYISKMKKVTICSEQIENFQRLVEELNEPDTTGVNVIDNKAFLNEINKRTGLGLKLNVGGRLQVEITNCDDEGYSCHVIYVISVTNLKELWKYADKNELPDGVTLRIFRYEIW